jgi:hypothetical protein
MAAAGRKRDIAIRVMVTAKEQAEIRKAANKAAMPTSVYVRAKALAAARAGDERRSADCVSRSWPRRRRVEARA